MKTTITERDTEMLHERVKEFGPLTPRELQLYFEGQRDGKVIKANAIAPRLAYLELTVANYQILFPAGKR